MIVKEKIKINISYRNISHYQKLGYNPILQKELEIKIIDLPIVSHQKIDVRCEVCGIEKNIMYCKYIENKNRCGYYGCKKCSRQKAAYTSNKIYGVDNYMMLDEAKEKMTNNNIKKYGVKTTLLEKNTINKIKKTMMDLYGTDKFYEINRLKENYSHKKVKLKSKIKKIEIKNNDIEDPSNRYKEVCYDNYLSYRREVRRLTIQSNKILSKSWDGYDFYDGEYIMENYKLPHNNKNYPTIDHKISIYEGYINKIPPSNISHIDNLCMTKRSINSSKRDNTVNP